MDLATTETAETDATAVPAPIGIAPANVDGRPDPNWVRGRCPECGDDLVSNVYYLGGDGYLMVWECWASLGDNAPCGYRRVL